MELQVTKQIDIDVSKHKYISLDVKQYDRNVRFILIRCYHQEELLPINNNTCYASIRYRKPDGYGVFNNCEITDDGGILVELTEQMLAVAGICYADLVIHENINLSINIVENADDTIEIIDTGDSGIISTMTFIVNVCEAAFDNEEIESSYEYNALNDLLIESRRSYENVLESCSESEFNAKESENNALDSAILAESYAIGGTGTREDEDTNNTKYYYEQSVKNVEATIANAEVVAANTEIVTTNALLSQSYAVGGTDTRENEDSDNAKYYYEQSSSNADIAATKAEEASLSESKAEGYAIVSEQSMKSASDSATVASESASEAYNYYLQVESATSGLNGAFLPMGTVEFAELATLKANGTVEAGYLYNISDDFTTDDTFKCGAGINYISGTNVYYTADNYWDCLTGTTVTGVKGYTETNYRKGNVNITAGNVGAISTENIATIEEVKYWLGADIDTDSGSQINTNYPTLSDEKKLQLQNLIDQYMRVRNSLFYYTGSVRRESYAYTGSGEYTYYSYNTPKYPVLQKANEKVDPDNPDIEYFKYMLNCGLFCQMIWMGRPISDFLTGETDEENLLLDYAEGKMTDDAGEIQSSPKTAALTFCPTTITNINSVFKDSSDDCWGYYFDFVLSKKAYNATNSEGNLYSYNSFFKYDNNPISVALESVDTTTHTSEKNYGDIKAYPLTNQVTANCLFLVTVLDGQTISAGTNILLGTIVSQTDINGDERWYRPTFRTAIAVHHLNKMFAGYINHEGEIYVYCDEDLTAGTYSIGVNTSYVPKNAVQFNGETLPLGFDGASNMAEELYILGCEIPYSQIDIGDLVFIRSSDISNDFRNKLEKDDDDALSNRSFRHISHVGIVYDINEYGYPVIADCTNAYSNPTVIGKTAITSNDVFTATKASYERNNIVMVARHPAAFGLGGNVPDEFTTYRGSLVGQKWA